VNTDIFEVSDILRSANALRPSGAGLRWFYEQSGMDLIDWMGAQKISPVMHNVVTMMMDGAMDVPDVIYFGAAELFDEQQARGSLAIANELDLESQFEAA